MNRQRRAFLRLGIAVGTGLSAIVSSADAAQAAGPEPHYAPVKVETSFKDVDPERVKRVQPVLKKRAIESLKLRHGIENTTDAKATIVLNVLDLEERPDPKKMVVDYGVRVEVLIDGENVGDEIVQCMQKGEAELVDCAVSGIETVLEFLPTEERPAPAAETPGVAPGPEQPAEPVDNGPKRVAPIGALGITGVVVGVGGLATAIAGGVYLARGEASEDLGGRVETKDYRPRGRTLVGIGAGVFVVGAVLVGVDVGTRAKKRKQAASRLRIDVGPQFTGFTVRGRF